MDQSPPSDSPLPSPENPPENAAAEIPPESLAPADDLPEWEPLSPEILEDEAIRGDFVLRWAVVGLALLIACTEIFDARALMHVRSGEWLVNHGWLPPAKDPFSLTAADRRWVNLSWGFDLLSAGVYAVGGGNGLSLIKGLLIAVAVGLMVHTVRPGIRTWWGTLCASLTVLSAYASWEWQPELITFLGTAVLFFSLISQERAQSRQLPWWSVPLLFLVWGQLDPRAWVGLFFLLLYTIGRYFSRSAGESDWGEEGWPWGRVAGLSALALLCHPFLWETWLAPWTQYGVEYPLLRQIYPRPLWGDRVWYPFWSSVVWQQIDHRLVASLLLMLAALFSLVLNVRKATLSHWLCFAGANLLALLATHELAVASLVNCVIATVQAQEWYKERFGQVYSLAWQDILFSRGGRALTVAGFFGLAWIFISGRLDGPDLHRTGLGISRSLQQEITDVRRLADRTFDDRGFHFTLGQGDALIASGRRSFIDHRVRLFAGTGERDLVALHDRVRKSLRRTPVSSLIETTETADPDAWRTACDQYEISHVLPRLTANSFSPDYLTLLDLLSSADWTLTDLWASLAVFHRSPKDNPELNRFATEQSLNVIVRAFRSEVPPEQWVAPRERPVPPVWSQSLLSQTRRSPGSGSQLARHWLKVLQSLPTAPMPFQISIAVLATRAAQDGVAERPDLADSYRVLSECQTIWQQLEAVVLAEYQLPWTQSSRYFEAVSAARQAAELAPHDPRPQMMLIELYQTAGLADATYHAIESFLANYPQFGMQSDSELAQREALLQMRGRLVQTIAETENQLEKALSEDADRLQVATMCRQFGCLELAIKTLQDDAVYVERNPYARLQLSIWLAELGSAEELDDSVASLSLMGSMLAASPWREPVAYAALSRADFAAARESFRDAIHDLEINRLQSLLLTTAASQSSPIWLGDAQYPLSHLIAVQETMNRQAGQATLWGLYRCMAAVEQGDVAGARTALQEALANQPDSPLRPLMRVYWFCLTAELLDIEPPGDWIPIDPVPTDEE